MPSARTAAGSKNASATPADSTSDGAPKPDVATLMCVRAEAIRKAWSRGVSRKQRSGLWVSRLNRTISWKHVHFVLKHIFQTEGFTRLRYKNGICHDPNPADSEEVWRHSRKITDAAGGRLAAHPQAALVGVLAKVHLLLGLQALAHGAVAWDHDDTRITVPPLSADQRELHETLKEGIWMECLDYGAILQDEEAVRCLSLSDNLDQFKAMPEHEAEFLLRTWEVSRTAESQIGKTHWQAVQEVMAVRTAGAWTAEQLVFAYNFGKTLAAMHMKAIRLFHFFHVNATVLRIEVSFLGVLAQNIPLGSRGPASRS